MCRFHRFEEALSKQPFSHASDRSASGCNSRPSSNELFGCIPGIPLNTTGSRWLGEDSFCHFTPTGNYHYKVMSFELKNAGSTYQRMMTRMFESQLGKNIKVYIDDMVVKSKVVSELVGDLENIFEILRKHKLRLNASKCSFGMGSGKFLGYMVTHCGIEVNPDQVKAINSLQPPRNPKKVKKLTRMTAALNQFIFRLMDRCKPFF